MKVTILAVPLIFISTIAAGQKPKTMPAPHCNLTGSSAANAVREYIFYNDPVFREENVIGEEGFVRISVFPRWDDDVSYQIRLVNGPDGHKSTVVKYSIPPKAHSFGKLVEKALKVKPCASVKQIASLLPIKRTVIEFRKEWKPMFDEVYQLNFRARPNSDQIWLDRTEYQVEYIGMNNVRLKSDDYDDPAVKWAIKVVNAIDSGN